MAAEVKLQPGWFLKDVRRAAERLNQWTSQSATTVKSAPQRGDPTAQTRRDSEKDTRKK
jgi:hypothetical protein